MSEVPHRWWFTGTSGSGKTTYAALVARELGVPHRELDALFHQADWTPLELDEFRARVAQWADEDGWVFDGNYSKVADLYVPRAQVIVAFDLSRPRVMYQVTRRTLRRLVRRVELWNGNRESWGQVLAWDPTRSIIRWAWTTHGPRREQLDRLAEEAARRGQVFVRARSHREARAAVAAHLGSRPTSV